MEIVRPHPKPDLLTLIDRLEDAVIRERDRLETGHIEMIREFNEQGDMQSAFFGSQLQLVSDLRAEIANLKLQLAGQFNPAP